VPDAEESPRLFRKKFLIGLAVMAVLSVSTGGAKQASKWVAKKLFPEMDFSRKTKPAETNDTSVTETVPPEEREALDLAKDIKSFHDWLEGRQPVEIDIIARPVVESNGVERAEVWRPGVSMTALREDGSWVTCITRPGCPARMMRVGDEIQPSEDSCGYRILSVSHRCVWLQALFLEQTDVEHESSRWSDIVAIEHDPGQPGIPHRVHFAGPKERTIARGEPLVLRNGMWTIEDLWRRGVHLACRPRAGTNRADLVCVMVK